jgi:hypothetical protein
MLQEEYNNLFADFYAETADIYNDDMELAQNDFADFMQEDEFASAFLGNGRGRHMAMGAGAGTAAGAIGGAIAHRKSDVNVRFRELKEKVSAGTATRLELAELEEIKKTNRNSALKHISAGAGVGAVVGVGAGAGFNALKNRGGGGSSETLALEGRPSRLALKGGATHALESRHSDLSDEEYAAMLIAGEDREYGFLSKVDPAATALGLVVGGVYGALFGFMINNLAGGGKIQDKIDYLLKSNLTAMEYNEVKELTNKSRETEKGIKGLSNSELIRLEQLNNKLPDEVREEIKELTDQLLSRARKAGLIGTGVGAVVGGAAGGFASTRYSGEDETQDEVKDLEFSADEEAMINDFAEYYADNEELYGDDVEAAFQDYFSDDEAEGSEAKDTENSEGDNAEGEEGGEAKNTENSEEDEKGKNEDKEFSANDEVGQSVSTVSYLLNQPRH